MNSVNATDFFSPCGDTDVMFRTPFDFLFSIVIKAIDQSDHVTKLYINPFM